MFKTFVHVSLLSGYAWYDGRLYVNLAFKIVSINF